MRSVQEQGWANKRAKGFNPADIALEFGLLAAEISEAFNAWRNRLPDFGEELADVLSYLAGLAQMAGIDLSHEVERKLAMRPTGSTVRTRKESWTERITLADGGPRLSILVPGL